VNFSFIPFPPNFLRVPSPSPFLPPPQNGRRHPMCEGTPFFFPSSPPFFTLHLRRCYPTSSKEYPPPPDAPFFICLEALLGTTRLSFGRTGHQLPSPHQYPLVPHRQYLLGSHLSLTPWFCGFLLLFREDPWVNESSFCRFFFLIRFFSHHQLCLR